MFVEVENFLLSNSFAPPQTGHYLPPHPLLCYRNPSLAHPPEATETQLIRFLDDVFGGKADGDVGLGFAIGLALALAAGDRRIRTVKCVPNTHSARQLTSDGICLFGVSFTFSSTKCQQQLLFPSHIAIMDHTIT